LSKAAWFTFLSMAELRGWIDSKDYNKQMAAVQYGYGKVEDESRNISIVDDFILNNIDLFTDGQILRIQQGEDKSMVVAEVLRDAAEVLKKLFVCNPSFEVCCILFSNFQEA